MPVVHIPDEDTWINYNEDWGSEMIVVIHFSAGWCYPCREVEPLYAELSEEFADVQFCSADVDECPSLAKQYHIAAMPSFAFLIDKELKATVVGATMDKVKEELEKVKELALNEPDPFA
eukprot:TRINITY_DN13975_c0_g1_i1.p1 TRINITY_DN13975_c0_g1~~TRINITY_DN13975_c0_g1_i1.p1  ORF type:complete len:119 (+),score=29.14 TRINITY_DN13975_c0_g1_i1:55-411(+)